MVIDNEIMVCEEPEFEMCEKLDASVDYFVVCKKGKNKIGNLEAYEALIAGEKSVSWVARACENAKIFEINDYQDEMQVVMQNLTNAEYTVILWGNLPLINKQHLKNLVNYVMIRNMNACKLKGGYIFKTEYLTEVGEIFSADTYNLKTNDFFMIENFESLEFARREIARRIFAYHAKNGVEFENQLTTSIDANVQIEYASKISSGSRVLNCARLGSSVSVGSYSIIDASSIKEDSAVGSHCFVKNSTIGANVKIGDNVFVENCKIGNGCELLSGTRLLNVEVSTGAKICEFCDIKDSKIGINANVGAMSRLNRVNIEDNYNVFEGKVIINRVEED